MKLGELLKHAMELEKVQAKIYEGLAKKFSFSKEISEFWSGMAEDEKGHYEHIKETYNQLGLDHLSKEVGNDLSSLVCKGLSELRLACLDNVFDLDDACELAHDVENYEAVAVLKFVHPMLKHDRVEISNIILAHLDKLSVFSGRFGSGERKRIKASA